jgi:3-hydroxy-2-methylpyridine-4,5-dicarboxylate 4-decarboxylase
MVIGTTRRVESRARGGKMAITLAFMVGFLFFACAGSSYAQIPFTMKPKTADEAVDQLVWANRILSMEGIFDFLGHISVRNPENPKTFFISRGIAPETVTKKDVLEVDQQGKVLTRNPLGNPYSERIIHAAIYKMRPEINSVIHAHPQVVVAFTISEVQFKMVAHPACIFYEGIPYFDEYIFKKGNGGMLIQTAEEGDLVAKALGPKAIALWMKGHGYNVTGQSIPNAVRASIELRDNVNMLMMAAQFGKVWSMSYEDAKYSASVLGTPERAWGAWINRVKKSMPDMKTTP